MAVKNSPPSQNPANGDSLTGLFKLVLEKFLQGVDDMLPAQVISFDRTQNRAMVKPLVMMVDTLGARVPRASVSSVPVMQLGGGNFMLNFNLVPGDLGWIKANDRDISLFLQGNYQDAPPNTRRKHSFEDAVFIPNIMGGYTIDSEDTDNMVLQNLDGTVRIALWSNKVKITAPTVEIDTLNLNCSGSINVTGDVIAGTVSLKNHTHPGVMTGPGNTGAPNA